jgi:hypothetical protein
MNVPERSSTRAVLHVVFIPSKQTHSTYPLMLVREASKTLTITVFFVRLLFNTAAVPTTRDCVCRVAFRISLGLIFIIISCEKYFCTTLSPASSVMKFSLSYKSVVKMRNPNSDKDLFKFILWVFWLCFGERRMIFLWVVAL